MHAAKTLARQHRCADSSEPSNIKIGKRSLKFKKLVKLVNNDERTTNQLDGWILASL